MSAVRTMDVLRRQRSCAGKVRHASQGKADAAARSLADLWERTRGREGRKWAEGYHCEFCLGYHVGTARTAAGRIIPGK